MRLIDMKNSSSGQIVAIHGESSFVERLEEMGLSLGRSLIFVQRIPFGGPYIVRAGSSFIALRDDEAEFIEVEPCRE